MIDLPWSHSVLIMEARFLLEKPIAVCRSKPFIHGVLLAPVSRVSVIRRQMQSTQIVFLMTLVSASPRGELGF